MRSNHTPTLRPPVPTKPLDRLAQRAAWLQLLDLLCLGGPEPPPLPCLTTMRAAAELATPEPAPACEDLPHLPAEERQDEAGGE